MNRWSIALASFFLAAGAAFGTPVAAQGLQPEYSFRWDIGGLQSPPDRVIIYLHGRSGNSMDDVPVPLFIQSLALRLNAGLARVIRPPARDGAGNDPAIVEYLRDQVLKLRLAGARHILLAGVSRGGWLAIKAARDIEGVDDLLSVAPASFGLTEPELESQAAAVVSMLSATKAKRVALFFFKDDPREAVAIKRGDMSRPALAKREVSYLIEDQPDGLSGHGAIGLGRFNRRYLDCTADFFAAVVLPAGEQHCNLSSGYATGADIRFPKATVASPRDVTTAALRGYSGRWQGDDEYGRYWILLSSEFSENSVTFLFGHSPAPNNAKSSSWVRELKFLPSKEDPDRLEHVSAAMKTTFLVKLLSNGDLELTIKPLGDDRVYAPAFLKRVPPT